MRRVVEGVERGAEAGADEEDVSWAERDVLLPDDGLEVAQRDGLSGKWRDGDLVLGGPGGVVKENTAAGYAAAFGPC